MNKQFNLLGFAKAYPQASMRRVMCNSMLGVLNHNIIAMADKIAEQLVNEKVDYVTLDERDLRALMSAVDDQGDVSLKLAGRVKALQAEFYELLRVTTTRSLSDLTTKKPARSLADAVRRARDKDEEEKAPWGSLERAIADATGVQNVQAVQDIANKRKMLAAVNVTLTDSDLARNSEAKRMRAQMFADRRAARVGAITWIIDKMFSAPAGDVWNSFGMEEREFFCEKVKLGLDKVDDRVKQNVCDGISGDDVLGIADILFARDCKKQLTEAMDKPTAVKPKAPRAKAKQMQVVKKNGAIQKLDAAARKATSELLNGVADSSNGGSKVKRTNAVVEKLHAESNGVTTG